MPTPSLPGLAIVGGGPAGLMAAETARAAGHAVDLFEAKGSVGRKFLIAGKGGLNLTHSDPPGLFASRYGERHDQVARWLHDFDADALRAWAAGLGVETFVGSSGRVFPSDLKAAPLLRGWVRRLREQGVRFHVLHRWTGFDADGALRFDTPEGEARFQARATVLAMGGGSWPELGSDGAWVAPLAQAGVDIAPLQPANCGFDVGWSEHFAQRFAGAPIKPVRLAIDGVPTLAWRQGECVATATGLEGSLVYALSAALRERLRAHGEVTLRLDLAPGRDEARLFADLSRPRKGRSLGEHLRRSTGIEGVKAGLLREVLDKATLEDPARLAAALKSLPVRLLRPRPIAEAISSAGGVRLESLDEGLMLRDRPGLFCAGEMLDWEAPTGGYLLTACFASGYRAGRAAAGWLARPA
ncbi:TIGR03862 family flavoprotein [Arenimonas terrae]|uniref:TIGR03862 family flavoprotein n=1 Tax=Arenimonas terrae TaxID=2546226 RepID=A0A5C4RUT8_9GAMM|nr:TIGR03862 family flavoprotein [Arenimonas terrae]TNJ34754.1 TIGR03862 family flavoprotein [Arenimonas terrae]